MQGVPVGLRLAEDGSALDPAAFVAALRADPAKMEALRSDPDIERIVFGDDVEALQELLRDVYKVGPISRSDGGHQGTDQQQL
jgi:hypothetical protein